MSDNRLPREDPPLDGEFIRREAVRRLYSTDASEFEELPAAVAFPRSREDIRRLVEYARRHRVGLIPRGAGTSLAGQVVGNGIVVDVSRYLNRVIEIDPARRRVRVEPGLVRHDLNVALKPHGLFFAPETSTADRATIGGMVGNNSCGANSIVYGTTRDHLISARGFLGDGEYVEFRPLDREAFERERLNGPPAIRRIYEFLHRHFSDPEVRAAISDAFPKKTVSRRNTGYALDALMNCSAFDSSSSAPFNFCRAIAGSEGTLFIGVEFELNLEALPPPPLLLCVQFGLLSEAFRAAPVAIAHAPSAVELIDRHIIESALKHPEFSDFPLFVHGVPEALLMIEARDADPVAARRRLEAIAAQMKERRLGTAFGLLSTAEMERLWALRKAGQALIMNVEGDEKPAEIIEDTAVAVEDLANYMREFDSIVRGRYGLRCVYYGHAGAGEIHARPYLNLASDRGLQIFRALAQDIAALVKKYRGSLSGEHGDGRLRGEFLRFMVGDRCYRLMRELKAVCDPEGIFNPGKILDAPPLDENHRHKRSATPPSYKTYFDFSHDGGLVRAAARCNGSAVCRKSHLAGGLMCPSFMATRDEKDTTRARANLLRQLLLEPPSGLSPFADQALYEVMDLCLSCKGCKTECPTSVDMARLKAEFLQQYYDARGTPLQARLVAWFAPMARIASVVPPLWNRSIRTGWVHRLLGFDTRRRLPPLPPRPVQRCLRRASLRASDRLSAVGRVVLFVDEFTRYQDPAPALATFELLSALGYTVEAAPIHESGRAAISKGLLKRAKVLAKRNVARLSRVVDSATPLIGVEPSAILTFRDEYIDLVPDRLRDAAQSLAANTFTIEEFLIRELDAGRLGAPLFVNPKGTVHVHVHCHQKTLSSIEPVVRVLKELGGYDVRVIPAGCCGMAGSFGYEAAHYDIAMKIGNLVLFPYLAKVPADHLIAATGISCRQQIRDGTGREARHPVELLEVKSR